MYGFFNHAFGKYITHRYGKEKWEIIRLQACIFEENFDEELMYDDNMIIELVDAACDVLGMQPEDLQTEFGESYFDHCLQSHHGELLQKLGGNLYDFLCNIDTLHEHISVSYAGAKMPTFRVKEDLWRRCITVFYSDRNELEFVTKGIIEKAAEKLFNIDVNVQIFFDVNPESTLFITTEDPSECDKMFPRTLESSRDLIPQSNEPKVSPLEFARVFPFHMIFDREMNFLQIGSTLRRILKDINTSNKALVTSFFSLSRPQILFDFDSIYSRLNNAFILTSLEDAVVHSLDSTAASNSSRRSNLRLKGQMIYIDDRDAMLYLCSPSVSNIEDLRNKGLYLSDIPIHDATRDLVLLSDNIQKERDLTEHLSIVRDHLEKIHSELEEEVSLYNRLLFSVLPNAIATRLCEALPVPTEKYESVTLMFSGIVDFPTMCQELESSEIVAMLNELYTKFDMLVSFMDRFAYKVETVGDKYMTASGLPERVSAHPYAMCSLALHMHDAAKEVYVNGDPISVTFGVHSGEVVAGVIGQKMPRYCVFGNAVNLTSRAESTGLPGKINVTEYTYKLLEDTEKFSDFHFEKRGEVEMKGRSEPMTTYLLKRGVQTVSSNSAFPLSLDYNDAGPNALLTSPLSGKGGGYTLNRVRANSTIGGFRKSRSASNQTSRFNTPGQSRMNSRYATPLRSRCNSALSTSPYLPSASLAMKPNQFFEADEDEAAAAIQPKKAATTRVTIGGFEALDEVETASDNLEEDESVFDDGEGEELQITSLADLPSSVSPLLQRRVDVEKVLNAVNKTLSPN